MEASEIKRLIRLEVERQMNIVLTGVTQSSDKNNESIASVFPGMGTIPDRPKVEPYGFHSRAPDGTFNVSARGGADPGSRMVIGHRDANRPDVETGETAVYSLGGYTVLVGLGSIQIGKDGEYETMVVGDTLLAFLQALLTAIGTHTHIASGTPPTNAATFSTLAAENLDNGKILAEDGGRY